MASPARRRARLLVRTALVAAAAAVSLALAPTVAQATATSTIPVHASQVPTTAAGFTNHSCDNIPGGASATLDGWAFVLPGNKGAFVSLTLTFTKADGTTTTVGVPPSGGILTNGTSKAWVQTPKGWTLTAASAVITGSAAQGYFNITHTCPATGSPSPSPSASKSNTPSPSPSTGDTSTSPSASPSGSASASGPATTGPTSGSPSGAGGVATSPAGGISGLPVTGVALTGFVVAGLALVGVGTVLVLGRRRRRVTG
jgi:hypothetical protein